MKASGKVAHKGKIISIHQGVAIVNIISESACSTCHAKGMCTMADMKEKEITVPVIPGTFQEGEKVQVVLRTSLGLRAVWWAYLFPLLLLLTILLILLNISISELWSALLALMSVVLYYILLWIFRDKLKRKFVFDIEKLNR